MAAENNRPVEKVVQFDEILERRFATAPIEWIDEQLCESGLDYVSVLQNVQAIIGQAGGQPVRREKRSTMTKRVAAAIVAGLFLLGTPAVRYRNPTAEFVGIVLTHHEPLLIQAAHDDATDLAFLFADRPSSSEDLFLSSAASALQLPQCREEYHGVSVSSRDQQEIKIAGVLRAPMIESVLAPSIKPSRSIQDLWTASRNEYFENNVQQALSREIQDLQRLQQAGLHALVMPVRMHGAESALVTALQSPRVRNHRGVDIFAPRGTPVVAVTDGVIKYVGEQPRGGNCIWLMAEDGRLFFYAHLDRWEPTVFEGKDVKAGEVIGYVGNTGIAKTGPAHLHFYANIPDEMMKRSPAAVTTQVAICQPRCLVVEATPQ